jgi:hypothetical protein
MSEGNDDKWEMPEPVFRSSTGSLPKSFEDTISVAPNRVDEPDPDDDIVSMHELPTLQPHKPEDDILGILDLPAEESKVASSEEVLDDHAEPPDPKEAAAAEQEAIVETQPKRASFWTFTSIFLLIVLIAGVLVFVVFYYLQTPGAE